MGETLVNLFDDSIIENAKLILFPFYQFGKFDDFFDTWLKKDYYHEGHWKDFYSQINEAKRESGNYQSSLFDFLF